jgi:hypothetical protein
MFDKVFYSIYPSLPLYSMKEIKINLINHMHNMKRVLKEIREKTISLLLCDCTEYGTYIYENKRWYIYPFHRYAKDLSNTWFLIRMDVVLFNMINSFLARLDVSRINSVLKTIRNTNYYYNCSTHITQFCKNCHNYKAIQYKSFGIFMCENCCSIIKTIHEY